MTVSENHPAIHLGGLSNRFYRNSIVCFGEQKPFVLKQSFLTLGLGMCEGVNEGSRHGSGWITFSSISCRHLSRDLHVLLECVCVEPLHVHILWRFPIYHSFYFLGIHTHPLS